MLLIKAQLKSNNSSEIQFTSSTPFISDGQTAFGIFSSKNLGDSIQRRRKRHRLVGDWTGGWSHWDKEIKTERKQETHVRKEGKYKTGRRQKKGRQPPPVGEKKKRKNWSQSTQRAHSHESEGGTGSDTWQKGRTWYHSGNCLSFEHDLRKTIFKGKAVSNEKPTRQSRTKQYKGKRGMKSMGTGEKSIVL